MSLYARTGEKTKKQEERCDTHNKKSDIKA